jgi:hypothetical protein
VTPELRREIERVFPPAVRAAAMARLRVTARPDGEAAGPDHSKYRDDPVGFARDVLRVTLTPDQERIARAFLVAPYRVKVRAGHNVGKTFLFAVLALWWYWTRPESVVITTAPTLRDVVDLLWTEVRLLSARAGLPDHFVGPAAPELRSGPDHWAKGYTASKGESFQGRHRANMLFLFDEDDGLPALYFERTRMMFKPGDGHAWGSIGNPYTTSSQSAMEEHLAGPDGQPAWNLFTLSCLTHPNVLAELRGDPPPVPNAVSLAQVTGMVAEKCQPIPADQAKEGDLEWPPASGKWHRPGPLFEAGVMGLRPTQGTNAVWSEHAWQGTLKFDPEGDEPERLARAGTLPRIGVDVAVFGDDWTAIHTRIGRCSLAHRAANGWGPDETAGAVKEECRRLAAWMNALRGPAYEPVRAEQIPVAVELDGYGAGVLSHGKGWNWAGVSASATAGDPEQFQNARSELWFVTREKAARGLIDLSRLSPDVRTRLRQQLLAPTYRLNGAGQKVVERKDEMKKRLGRSPDDADGFNISHYDIGTSTGVMLLDTKPARREYDEDRRRGPYGR